MKYFAVIFFIFTSLPSFGTNYYVSPAGNNGNNGLTVGTAFQTLNYAADQTNPGDTVFVLNGTYTNPSSASNVLDIYNSGTANNRITYINYPGHFPVIKLNGNNWSGIAIQGADYITIDGFRIIGNNDSISLAYALLEQTNTNNPATSGNGIGITSEYNNEENRPHHIEIRNCTLSKCGGAGIYTYGADYITIANNTVFECAWYAPYGNSGISLFQNWNSDSTDVFRNYIIGNTCYRNENYIPFIAVGDITDGNGIIVDDGRNTQNGSTQGAYLGKTYIANNLIFDNGGRGIHVYLSDKVVIVNNTCYKNCQSPFIQDGEYTAYDSDSIYFINNIANPSANIPPIDVSNTAVGITVTHNFWAANPSLANPFGTNTRTGNPSFVSPGSDPMLADFHLQAWSTAIDGGTSSFAPTTDKDGVARSGSADIGCYEYQLPVSTAAEPVSSFNLHLYPNPGTTNMVLTLNPNHGSKFEIRVMDLSGRLVKRIDKYTTDGVISLDIADLQDGLYLIKVFDGVNNYATTKFVKLNH